MHLCNKCNKSFKSNYLLQKHLNRNLSCDEVLQCERCEKTFPTEKQMKQHLNRKNPCKLKTISKLEEQKEFIKFKHDLEMERIKAKKENSLEIIQKRKETKTINNTQINNFFLPPPQIKTYDNSMENTIEYFNKYVKTMSINSFDMKVAMCNTIKDVMVMVLKLFYNNPEFPEYKNIIYISDQDKFFKLNNMEWKEAKFEELYPLLTNTLMKTFSEFAQKGITNDCISNHYPSMISYNRVYTNKVSAKTINNHKKEVQDCAEEALIET
jgi:uncharacterized C2H2 Zn-finger protein